jgi:hypothetical protein
VNGSSITIPSGSYPVTLPVPIVTTNAASEVSATDATLNGTVNANGDSTTVTFDYGLDTGYGSSANASQSPVTGSSNTAVSAAVSSLTCNTTYHFRVKGVNGGGTSNGSDLSFTTGACNTAPVFVGVTTTLTVNQNSSANDIKSLLHVSDSDASQTETWSQSAAPSHGSLSFSSATAGSGSSDITPGGTITYTPTSGYSGSDSFIVQVSDGTATATRTITVTVVAPEINITGNSNTIADGDASPSATDHTDFGAQSVCSGTVVRTFTIQNTGNGDLTIASVNITGPHATDFSLTASPSSLVAASGSTTFQVTFNPSASGTRSATITVNSNDNDEAAYDFAIQGTGVDPEVNVTGNGFSIADGDATPSATDHTDFGAMAVASGTIVRTFTIQNTGTINLTIGTVVSGGMHAADFSVTASPSWLVAAAGSTTFQVTFNPSAAGTRSADISFTCDDCDEATYNFAIQGTGIPSPAITSVSPSSGPTAGGTPVVITGVNFTGAAAVKFGGSDAASYIIDSATQITAVSPAVSAGTVDITVTTAGGSSATCAADQFTYVPAPTVTGISPTSGPTAGGTSVTITGTNFTGASAVTIGGTAATTVTVVNATTITATTPAGTAGAKDVVVTTPGGTGTGLFTYVTPPTISKAFGAAGILLNGSASLSFTVTNPAANSIPLTGLAFTDNLPAGLTVATPNGLSGSCGGGTITATAGAGSVSLTGATLAADSSCTFSVNVTGTTVGIKNNSVQITSTETGVGNTANSSITVAAPVQYAKPGGLTSGFCDSWDNACELRYALASAVSGQEIWVRWGGYTPTAGSDRSATFRLVSGVALYGGFTGSETLRSQRNIATNLTLLSGDLLGDDGTFFGNNADNSIHVVTGSDNAFLDGFTVSGGNADAGSGSDSVGGGMYNDNVSPTVANCVFYANMGVNGAGMANRNSASPTVTNCSFSYNLSGSGAAMINDSANPVVTNSTFSDNLAITNGGAMMNYQASPTVTNSTFSSNNATFGGAILNAFASAPVLTNCTFSGNDASTSGGAMYNTGSSNPVIRNSIFWGDSAGIDEIFNNDTSTTTVSYSVVQGGYAGTGNINVVPLLATLGDYGGITQTMPLLPGSAAINVGNSCGATDQRGQARVGACDIGAFESQGFTFAKAGGDNQSALISTSFASPLALTVTANNAGEPVNGGMVTFTAPVTGASTNPASTTATIAGGGVSITATANGTTGSYNVVAGTAGATGMSFTLSNVAPVLLTINFAGDGGNKVESTSPDQSINCLKGGSSGCSAGYATGTPVTLNATADWKSTFMGWSGDYVSSDNPGTVTMTADKTVTATFDPIYKVRLMPNAYFASIQDAYASVPSGSLTIQAQAWSFLEDLLFNNGTAVTLTGGMDESYNPTSGYATVKSLTVGTGSVVIGNISIR